MKIVLTPEFDDDNTTPSESSWTHAGQPMVELALPGGRKLTFRMREVVAALKALDNGEE